MTSNQGSPGKPEHKPTLKRKILLAAKSWRLPAFAAIAAIAIIIGLHYKDLSDPGEESTQFANATLPSFNIFVSNPNDSVTVNVDVSCGAGTSPAPCTTSSTARANLSVTVPSSVSSGTILVTSNVYYVGDSTGSLPFSHYGAPPGNARVYEKTIPIGPGTSRDGTTFDIPNVVDAVRGSVFGRLPVIGNLGSGDLWPSMLTEDGAGTSSLEDLIYQPAQYPWAQDNLKYMEDPAAYETLHGGHGTKLFWNPRVLSVTEQLEDITGVVSTQQVDYMSPAVAVTGTAYSWSADTLLQPQFKSTDPGASDSQTQNAFIAGILLGIAGAAVLAFLQELPPHDA